MFSLVFSLLHMNKSLHPHCFPQCIPSFTFDSDSALISFQVILCANSRPTLNDVTYNELTILVKRVAEICPQISAALAKDRLLVMESGQGSPCLDLRWVSVTSLTLLGLLLPYLLTSLFLSLSFSPSLSFIQTHMHTSMHAHTHTNTLSLSRSLSLSLFFSLSFSPSLSYTLLFLLHTYTLCLSSLCVCVCVSLSVLLLREWMQEEY